MTFLALQAFFELIRFDLYLARGDFSALYSRVRNCPLRTPVESTLREAEISSAVDLACIWYWKEALCLQRSAATACLMKRYGVPAQLVIGVQQMPFRAHAWVEVNGRVVNDKPYMRDIYAVLESC